GRAGDNLQLTQVLRSAELRQEVAVALLVIIPSCRHSLAVKIREVLKGLFPLRPEGFLLGKLDELFDMTAVTLLEKRIQQHRAKGRGQCEGKSSGHAVAAPGFQQLEQRNVGFGDRFKKPVFFEKTFVFR